MIAPTGTPAAAATGGDLRASLAGVTASLGGDFEPFLDYAGEHLAPLCARAPADGSAPQVRAYLRWHEGPPPARAAAYPDLDRWDRLDRDLYRSGTRLVWLRIDDLPDLHLRFDWDGRQLVVEGDYYHRLSKTARRDWLRRVIYHRGLPAHRRRRFTTLLYYLVYYPCFWWLEHHGVCHPIHAGGVEFPEGVVALAGPSGVGKSTLVTGLASDPAARLLSDTFLLHRGATVHAVPEPLLLDQWSRHWLGANAGALQPIRHRYSLARDGFHWPDDRLSDGGAIRLLVFPQRAPSHYTKPLPPDQAQGRIRAGDLIVNDLRRYWAFAAVLEVMNPSPLVQERERSLAELVAAVPAIEIGLTTAVQREELVATIRGQLRQRRV